jgi:tartrate dehydratase beta subunit/fumarate hydratase class I family protein
MVEFAILLPALVMILAIAADFGRAFTAYIAISGAAREGAASAMQTGDLTNVEAVVDADIGNGGSIWGTNVGVFPSLVADDGQGYEQVVVRVEYTFSPMIPIPALPSSINMERTVRMRVLN